MPLQPSLVVSHRIGYLRTPVRVSKAAGESVRGASLVTSGRDAGPSQLIMEGCPINTPSPNRRGRGLGGGTHSCKVNTFARVVFKQVRTGSWNLRASPSPFEHLFPASDIILLTSYNLPLSEVLLNTYPPTQISSLPLTSYLCLKSFFPRFCDFCSREFIHKDNTLR